MKTSVLTVGSVPVAYTTEDASTRIANNTEANLTLFNRLLLSELFYFYGTTLPA